MKIPCPTPRAHIIMIIQILSGPNDLADDGSWGYQYDLVRIRIAIFRKYQRKRSINFFSDRYCIRILLNQNYGLSAIVRINISLKTLSVLI